MSYIINISQEPKGFGTVTGAGEQTVETEITLTATAADASYPFIQYILESGEVVTTNPYTFTTPSEDGETTIQVIFDYQLRAWLQAETFIEMEEDSLTAILVARELGPHVQFVATTKREQELTWADCIKVIITSWGEHTEKMQGWSSTRKLKYRKSLIDMMNNIYAKYGEDEYGSVIVSRSNLW